MFVYFGKNSGIMNEGYVQAMHGAENFFSRINYFKDRSDGESTPLPARQMSNDGIKKRDFKNARGKKIGSHFFPFVLAITLTSAYFFKPSDR